MDLKKHSAFTGAKAKISRKEGGKFLVYDDYVMGKNIELVADKKIVQMWHAKDWESDEWSEVTFALVKAKTRGSLSRPRALPAAKEITHGWKSSTGS
jgi:activator of HSP90 ATPase